MKIKTSLGRRTFVVLNYAVITFICITMIFPYLNVLAKAFNDGLDTGLGNIWLWPRKFTLENFQVVIGGKTFLPSVIVTVLRVIIGVVLGLLVQFGAAYALARKRFPGKSIFVTAFMIPMYITAGQIPLYVLLSNLHLLNNFWVYILPSLFSFYNIVIIRTFIQSTIPSSLEESALIDGAGEITVFFRIILPLCKPILATIALWLVVYHWNDWTTTLLYIRKSSLYTMQYIMMEMVKESERMQKLIASAMMSGKALEESSIPTSEALTSAQIVVTTIPIICVYPFLQKYFVKGIMMGSVKG